MSSDILSEAVLSVPEIASGVFTDTASRDIAVSVRGLAKSYSITKNAEKHSTLGESLAYKLKNPFAKVEKDTFWALNDVNFDIQKGDVVGIIGRNGAGKSTLLKVLSRITEPTRGKIDLYGRVGSLLEVGTGFHPELTGRENIYLNGAILGMKKSEIARQFDAIVDFSGTEKFLDTPVKRYSSGMYVRLAFAVAAHLNPEILIIDEVLAVGDAEFQKKCLGKMQDVADSGRTVLFVSHNMAAVTRLCNQAIFLKDGHLIDFGGTSKVSDRYLSDGNSTQAQQVFTDRRNPPGDEAARLHSIRILDDADAITEAHDIRRPIHVEVEYENFVPNTRPTVILHFMNETGVCLFATNDYNNLEWWKTPRNQGMVKAICHIPGNLFAEGRITVLVALGSYNPNIIHALVEDAVSFQIIDSDAGDAVRGESATNWPGIMRPMLSWDVRQSAGGMTGVADHRDQ